MAFKGARGTVSIIDKATSPLKAITGAFKNMGKASNKANDDLTRTQKALGGIGKFQNRLNRTAAGLDRQTKGIGSQAVGVVALGFALKSALSPAIKFEQAMKDLESVAFGAADATVPVAKNMAALSKQAKQLGATTAFSATQAAEGQLFLAKAGFKTNEILKAMPSLLDLAAASGTDLGRSSDILSDLLGAFGKTAEDTGRLADLLAAATSSANVDMETLFETLKVAAPIGKKFGASMQEITTATALLGNVGIKGSMAGTALKNMFTNLASPASAGAKIMKELGINVEDSSGKLLPMQKILQNLGRSAKTLSQAKQIKVFSGVFGKIAMAGAINLSKAVASGDFDKMLKNLQKSEGVAKKMAKIRMDSTQGSIVKLMSAVEGIAIAFGTILTPAIRGFADILSAVTAPIQSFIEDNKWAAKAIGIFAGAILTAKVIALGYTASLWLMSPAIKAISLALTFTRIPLLAFNLLMMANPIIIFVAAAIALAAIGITIYKNWKKVVEVLEKVPKLAKSISDFTGITTLSGRRTEEEKEARKTAGAREKKRLAGLSASQREAEFAAPVIATPQQATQQIQASQVNNTPVQVILNAEGVKVNSVQTKGATEVRFSNSGVQN